MDLEIPGKSPDPFQTLSQGLVLTLHSLLALSLTIPFSIFLIWMGSGLRLELANLIDINVLVILLVTRAWLILSGSTTGTPGTVVERKGSLMDLL